MPPSQSPSPEPHGALPLVLALPFVSTDGEEGRYLAEGVSDELVLALSQLAGLAVVDLLLRGRFHLEQRPIGVKLAMQCFDRAIRLDGSAAAAYGALGILWANFGIFLALPPGQARERARCLPVCG